MCHVLFQLQCIWYLWGSNTADRQPQFSEEKPSIAVMKWQNVGKVLINSMYFHVFPPIFTKTSHSNDIELRHWICFVDVSWI